MANDKISVGQVMLAEYVQLKAEQSTRVGFRDNLIYATLGSMAAVVAATLSAHHNVELLLILPPVTVLLGWTYLVNDEKISAIGRYIRVGLAPDLVKAIDGDSPVFRWETEHRSDSRRRSRKILQLVVDLIAFCVSALVAVTVYLASSHLKAIFIGVSICEMIAVGILAVQIYLYADLRGDHQPDPGAGTSP